MDRLKSLQDDLYGVELSFAQLGEKHRAVNEKIAQLEKLINHYRWERTGLILRKTEIQDEIKNLA